MHELAVCQALIEQVEDLAAEHSAVGVNEIVVRIGPLAGVEQALLEQAYEIARAASNSTHPRCCTSAPRRMVDAYGQANRNSSIRITLCVRPADARTPK